MSPLALFLVTTRWLIAIHLLGFGCSREVPDSAPGSFASPEEPATLADDRAARPAAPSAGLVEARGNEPFWAVRVEGAEARVSTPEEASGVSYRDGAWSRDGRWLYTARRKDGAGVETLTLELIEERCLDTMSGAEYPWRAVLVRQGRRMEGCGGTRVAQ